MSYTTWKAHLWEVTILLVALRAPTPARAVVAQVVLGPRLARTVPGPKITLSVRGLEVALAVEACPKVILVVLGLSVAPALAVRVTLRKAHPRVPARNRLSQVEQP